MRAAAFESFGATPSTASRSESLPGRPMLPAIAALGQGEAVPVARVHLILVGSGASRAQSKERSSLGQYASTAASLCSASAQRAGLTTNANFLGIHPCRVRLDHARASG